MGLSIELDSVEDTVIFEDTTEDMVDSVLNTKYVILLNASIIIIKI